MATVKHSRNGSTRGWLQPRRLALGLGLGLAAIMLGLGAWKGPGLHRDAVTGTAFGARVACACRFVEGRPLAQCHSDFEPGMEMVSLSEDAAAKSVTARVPLLASATATLQPGSGCVLEKWGG